MRQLLLTWRFLRNNLKLSLINLSCLSIGLLSVVIICGFVYQEFNYDSDIKNSYRIFRVIRKEGDMQDPYTHGPLAQTLKSEVPEIEDAVRISFYFGYLACSAGENKFNEEMAIFADPGFFDLFSFSLIKGNSHDCLVSPNSVAISKSAAMRYFGNEDPIGRQLRIGEDKEITVTAVFSDFKPNSNFRGDLVLPLEKISKLTQVWIEPGWDYASDIHTFILLSDNADIDAVSDVSQAIVGNYEEEMFKGEQELSFQRLKDIHIENHLLWESASQTDVSYLYILLSVAFIILLISCINFLFLYIGTTVQRSINTGIKKVFGASRSVVFMEHFREVLVIIVISLVLTIFLFSVYQTTLARYFSWLPGNLLFDYKLLILLATVLIIMAVSSAIYPSLILSSVKPISTLNNSDGSKRGRYGLINVLVVLQFVLCIGLIASTVVMQKQVYYFKSQNPGYAKDELITIPLNMHVGDGINNDRFGVFVSELKQFPGIVNATISFSSPSSVNTGEGEAGWVGKPMDKVVKMNWNSVHFDYFETLGLDIIEGRGFNGNFQEDVKNWDTRTCSYILNQSAVREMGITDPIGMEFELWGFKGPVIGTVEDFNFNSFHSAITPLAFMIDPFFLNEIIVRIDPAVPSVLSDIENVWSKFVPDYPLEISFVNEQIKSSYQSEHDLSMILHVFSALAIFLGSMGLFTLTVLTVNRRTKEIGIRKVNGAKVWEVMAMLNFNFVKWVIIAFIIATPIAWYVMNRWLQNFAYKTELSWWIFALAGLMALFIALLTVSWQSWRAARRNPVEALRYE